MNFSKDLANLGFLIGHASDARSKINQYIRDHSEIVNKNHLKALIEGGGHVLRSELATILDCLTDLIDEDCDDPMENKMHRNHLAHEIGFENYFELFCYTRNATSVEVKDDELLKSVDSAFFSVICKIPEAGRTTKTLEKISKAINLHSGKSLRIFFSEKLPSIISQLKSCGIKMSKNSEDRYNTSVSPITREVKINITEGQTFEEVRAILHAMGHALWMLYVVSEKDCAIERDNTDTETAAVFVENLLCTDEDIRLNLGIPLELAEWQKFLTSYYLRMYTAKAKAELDFYQNPMMDISEAQKIYSKNLQDLALLSIEYKDVFFDEKPVSIEFINAIKNANSLCVKKSSAIEFSCNKAKQILINV